MANFFTKKPKSKPTTSPERAVEQPPATFSTTVVEEQKTSTAGMANKPQTTFNKASSMSNYTLTEPKAIKDFLLQRKEYVQEFCMKFMFLVSKSEVLSGSLIDSVLDDINNKKFTKGDSELSFYHSGLSSVSMNLDDIPVLNIKNGKVAVNGHQVPENIAARITAVIKSAGIGSGSIKMHGPVNMGAFSCSTQSCKLDGRELDKSFLTPALPCSELKLSFHIPSDEPAYTLSANLHTEKDYLAAIDHLNTEYNGLLNSRELIQQEGGGCVVSNVIDDVLTSIGRCLDESTTL